MDSRVVVSLLALGGYFAAARGVENFYPLSTFPMYSSASGEAISRIMARTREGEFVEVGDFSSWHCDDLPPLESTSCVDTRSIGYIDRDREKYIRAHPGAGAEPIELVRRVFSFDGAARPEFCTVTRCTATRQRP